MSMAFVSISKEKAKEVGYRRLSQFIYNSPFFMEKCPPDKKFTGVLKFNNGLTIKPVVANEGGVLGDALIGLVIDEAAFMEVVDKSKRAKGDETTYDAAFNIYSQAKIRMKSRFLEEGKQLPCKIVIASSAQYPDDFVSRRQVEVIQNGETNVFVSDLPLWKGKRPDKYSKQTFRVEVGDEMRYSRILEDGEIPRPTAKTLDVPINFLEDFQRDIDRSIRDIAGVPLLTLAPLINDRSKVYDAIRKESAGFKDYQCVHPFTVETTNLSDGELNKHLLCTRGDDGMLYPKVNPDAPRFIHVDPSYGKKDAFGFAMVHPTGIKNTVARNMRTGDMEECYSVSVYVDLMLRIVRPPDPGSDISWSDVEVLISKITECGFQIGLITADGVGAFLVQRLKQQGYDSEIISVDRTIEPYLTLKSCFNEGRITLYEYAPLEEELLFLEWNKKRNKVDHAPRRSKDVADALCGAVYNAVTKWPEYSGFNNSVSMSVG
jgi:hypothetical protein